MHIPAELSANEADLSGDTSYDVIVVGGGVAGSYAAWRLKTGELADQRSGLPRDPADRKIAILESSFRWGGRLESLTPPEAPDLRAEFGGMGFTSGNKIVTALVDTAFGLEAEPFPRGGDQNLLYLRGVRLHKSDLKDHHKMPYQLLPEEQGKGPMELIIWAVEKVLPGALNYDAAKWTDIQDNFVYKGRSLRDIGFWNFLLMNMSNEAFSFAHDAMGHFFEVANWNCGEALPWFLGDGTATYRTLTGGYDLLPRACLEAYADAGGLGSVMCQVDGVVSNGDGTLGVQVNGNTIRTSRVVLALPQRALQMLSADTVVVHEPDAKKLIDSVTGRRVMKIFLAYRTPWWNELEITDGSSSTDLPLGQAWYFTAPKSQGNTNSLLMASYNDTLATTYWEGLEGGEMFQNPAGGQSPFWDAQAPSVLMVEEVQRQLAEVHGVTPPTPYAASYRDWSVDPFGGAFYTWNVGANGAEVESKMLQIDDDVPLHIIGSAYSTDQGWAEGALATAERLVTEKLSIAPPTWLS